MEDYPEQNRFHDDNQVGYDGGEEQFHEQYEQPPEQQFDSGREFEAGGGRGGNNVDSEGNEFRDSSFSSRADAAAGKLFVGGVSWETTEENFTNYFSKYGEVADSVIMLDKHTGRPRGFGFITFADPVAADAVLEEEHVIDGRVVEVKRTVPREDIGFKGGSKRKKIFVGGIPTSLSDEELGDYFSTFGSIVEHQIMVDHKTGRSRGFGFVTFENEDALDKVFSEGKIHELGGKQVEIKRAEPKRPGDYSGGGARSYGGGGGGARSYGGGGGGAAGYGGYNSGGRYTEKRGRGYGGTGGYGAAAYGNYNNYAGNYAANYAGFYGGYGGYGGYGFGFGGPMYGNAGYGANGYGMPGGYGAPTGYGGGKGYGSGSADRGQGRGRGGSSYNTGRGYDRSGDSTTGRYHPYQN